jgi:hypothetical protein
MTLPGAEARFIVATHAALKRRSSTAYCFVTSISLSSALRSMSLL